MAQELPDADLADRMLQALDKYRQMNQRPAAEDVGTDSGGISWQTDPAVPGHGGS